jgi:NAD(P)-dependent dehydrogenase (short-subunit alcohol dehydrogenase family)
MRGAVEELVQEYGRLGIIFANAGINGVWAPIDELQPDEWARTVRTYLTGTYLTLHFAVPHLNKRDGGSVVITSSIKGTRVFPNAKLSAYSCTKAAQITLAQMQAVELAKHNIRVNAICPGKIHTAIQAKTERRNIEEAAQDVEYPDGKIPRTTAKVDRPRQSLSCSYSWCPRGRFISGPPIWLDGARSVLVG